MMCSRRGAIFVLTRGELARRSGKKKIAKTRSACTSFILLAPLQGITEGNPALSAEINYFRFEEIKKARKYGVCGLS
jgi:hypothetical protein